MQFLRIEMFFLIWALPVLLLIFWGGMKKRRRILAEYASGKGLKQISSESSQKRRWVKAGLLMAAFLFLIFALAGPRYGHTWREIQRRGVDLILAIDCSRSMLATDIRPTRLDRAKREIIDLLAMLEGDRIGLAAFAGAAFMQCPLTLDYQAFHIFLNALSPDFMPLGGTDIAGAVETALAGFDPKSNAEKAIVLITDGESTTGDPLAAARKAAEAGVKLFCIGVGKTDKTPAPDVAGGFKKDASGRIVLIGIDEETLTRMADLTGGVYVRSVAGDMDLEKIYRDEIRGKMEATEFSGGRKKIWEDRYQWFLGLAVLMLLLEMCLPERRKTAAGIMALIFFLAPAVADAAPFVMSQPMKKGLESYRKGEYKTALDYFIAAQINDPDTPEMDYNLGNASYRLKDFQEATRHFLKASNDGKGPLKQKSLYNLGNAYFKSDQFKEAVESYQKALELAPEDRMAEKNLEWAKKMLEQQKQPQKQQEKKQSKDGKSGENQPDDSESDDNKPGDNKSKNSQSKDGQSKENKSETDASGEKNRNSQKSGPNETKEDGSRESEKQESGRPTQKKQAKKDQAKKDQPSGNDEKKQTKKQGSSNATASKSNPTDRESEREKRAQMILNRLKDRPGGALAPHYEKRTVEKDW